LVCLIVIVIKQNYSTSRGWSVSAVRDADDRCGG
jgi:hypothetical protein